MTTNLESEINALLDSNDEKKKKQVQTQIKAKDEAAEFVELFKDVAQKVIRPALEKIKEQLDGRGRPCRIEEDTDCVTHDAKEQRAAVSIYFDISQDKYVSRLYEYAHVSFWCDKHSKVVQVRESTIAPNHGGHSGSGGGLKIGEVTEESVNSKVIKVLREIYK